MKEVEKMISTVEKADYTEAKVRRRNRAQDIIPIQKLYESGMRKLEGGRYAVTYEIKDIDYSSKSDVCAAPPSPSRR